MRRRAVAFMVVALVGAFVLVGAGPAVGRSSSVLAQLALVPLRKAEIGPVASSWTLQHDSGVVPNSAHTDGFSTAKELARLGRVIGFRLDYGVGLTSSAPVTEVVTQVTAWRKASGAKAALSLATREQLAQAGLSRFGLPTSTRTIDVPVIGDGTSAVSEVNHFTPTNSKHLTRESVRDGRFLLTVGVFGRSGKAVSRLATTLAARLDDQLHQALAGKLTGRLPLIPPLPNSGPPGHGPKPAALAIRVADLRHARVAYAGHRPTADRSWYALDLSPAGPYTGLYQNIRLCVLHAGAVGEAADWLLADTYTGSYSGATGPVRAVSVPLHGIPGRVFAQVVRIPLADHVSYQVHIALIHGPWYDSITAVSSSAISAKAVAGLAKLAARRMAAGLRS